MPTSQLFRDRLLDRESMNPLLRERYEREVHMMLEKKLSAPRRWSLILIVCILLVQAVYFLYAMTTFKALPDLAKISLGVGVLFAISFAVVLANVLRRGSWDIRTHSSAISAIVWVFVVIMITLFMIIADQITEPVKGMSLVLNGLVFLIGGAVFLLQNAITQAQLKTREKLLEIELRLAELREVIEKKNSA